MSSTKTGIIIPPPEIRKLADTTAPYVVKFGAQFENMVMEKEINNPQFCFLKPSDPYRAYFDHKIAECAKNASNIENLPDQNTEQTVTQQNIQIAEDLKKKEEEDRRKKEQEEVEQQEKKKLIAPDPDQYTVKQPKGISQLENDIIKHSAQFVAKNGKKFLVALTEREKQNPQFDFLKPTNDLFPYFLDLVESYTRCISIKTNDLKNIINNFKDKSTILNHCGRVFEYENYQKQEFKKKQQEEEEEKQKLAAIDWNDFIVVETIEFLEDEYYKPRGMEGYYDIHDHIQEDSSKVIAKESSVHQEKIQEQQRKEQEQQAKLREEEDKILKQKELQEKEKQEILLKEQKEKELKLLQSQIIQEEKLQGQDKEVKLKTDYVQKSSTQQNQLTKCPNCGKMIPINEMNEHLKIELMNKEAHEQKQQLEARAQKVSINEADEIQRNLENMKRKRPDIFGSGNENLAQQLIQEEEEIKGQKAEKRILWDGQAQNFTRTTANIAIMQHLERKKNEELSRQQLNIHKQALPPSFDQSSSQQNMVNIMPPSLASEKGVNVFSKKQHINEKGMIIEEGVGLIDENKWLIEHPEPITINIRIPDIRTEETSEFSLTGQTIQFSIPPSQSILSLKIQIAQRLNNLPAGKQIIKSSLFSSLRDEKSLAFYNTLNGATLELQIQ